MNRLTVIGFVAVVVVSVAVAVPAIADTSYRIPMFGCADTSGTRPVPANTPLFVQSGWISVTKGLVRSAIRNSTTTVTDHPRRRHNGALPDLGAHPGEHGLPGFWASNWRVDLPPLALGATATVTMTLSFAHPQVDLGLPMADDDHSGLQYFNLLPAGLIPLAGEPNPAVCTVTAS